jgi:cation transport ATPase
VGVGPRDGFEVQFLVGQNTEKIDTLVMDKTGTLTAGHPEVTGFTPAPGAREEEVLAVRA